MKKFPFIWCRGADSSWLQPWPGQGLDGAGPSTAIRSAGLGRVQLMMRHLASVGETYAQTALEDSSWGLWPASSSQAPASSTAFPPAAHRYPVTIGAMHRRTASHPANDNIANLLAMAETVREVLPHIPDEMIFQVSIHMMTYDCILVHSLLPLILLNLPIWDISIMFYENIPNTFIKTHLHISSFVSYYPHK